MSSSLDCLDLCRLCLIKDRVSVPIFEDEGDVRQIFLKITACLPVKVSRDDKLPKKICDDCVYKVELFYQFWNTTANAEKQLLQWLGEVDLEDKQTYVTEVLDTNVMKQEQNSDNRLEGNVIQVSGHQNNMDIGMIEDMTIMTIPAGSEQQFTTVPMDTSGTVQTVQAVPGPSTHDQMGQSQTHLVTEEVEESEEEENSDDGCDNEEGLPVKEETEEVQTETFVNVPISCDEAGPSGLQQQKVTEMSEMSMTQTATDGDPKTGYLDADIKSITTHASPIVVNTSSEPSSMTLYQISYFNGKPSYCIVPIKQKNESPTKKEKKENFACDLCNLKFPTEIRLKSHRSTHKPLEKQHQENFSKLEESDNLTSTGRSRRNVITKSYIELDEDDVKEEILIEEISSIKNSKKKNLTFICPSCDYNTTDRNLMIEHFNSTCCFQNELNSKIKDEEEKIEEEIVEEILEKDYETTVLTCAQCGFSSSNQVDIDFHTCSPHDDQTYTCPLCTYECPTRMGLQSHITRKHKPRPASGEPRIFECDECEFKSLNKSTLYSHRKKHKIHDVNEVAEEEVSYCCNECDFSTKSKNSLYLHIKRKHKMEETKQNKIPVVRPEFYSCELCDYTNKNRYEMKIHVIRKHTEDYNFACEICGKKYKIKGDLTNHIRFQHREQPIICDVCGKTCGNSNSLYVHQKFAHYKAEFECPICHRRMVTQANLDEHVLKQHEQRQDAICEECGKTFTRQSRLKIHMRIHTGLKPHSCKICGKAFTRTTALRQHLLIHTGQRPYVCDICGKAFTQKPGLISHRKSHPGNHPPLPRVTIDHVLSEFLSEEN